jgi:beta-lactamase class C
MYHRIIVMITLPILFHTTSASASETNQFVETTVQQFMHQTHAPGVAVALVQDGKPAVYVFGKADIDKNTPVTTNTIFEVGSITKLFTAILLTDDVIQHKLQLTDNITQHMPEVEKNSVMKRITLAQLASHTAGFPFSPPNTLKTSEDLKKYLLNWKPSITSDPVYQYSNIGIGILGKILEKQDQKGINQLYIERILSPLHMSKIGLKVPLKLKSDYAQGYLATGKPIPHADNDLFSAGYDIKMTINDLSKFLQASLNLKGTPTKLFDAIKLSQIPQVQLKVFQQALGWQVNTFKTPSELLKKLKVTTLEPNPYKLLSKDKQKFNPKALIEKTGSTDGFTAYIALVPELKSGVAILTNRAVKSEDLVLVARRLILGRKAFIINDQKDMRIAY